MAKVVLKDFSLRYYGHKKDTLSNINLSFNTDEKILLLSPSGYGKSSLFLSLLGIIQRNDLGKTKGTITIDGKDITTLSPLEVAKIFGIVFQNPENQFCTMTPENEIAFSLENFQVSHSMIEKKVKESIKEIGMEGRGKDQLTDLSGGEQQKIAIASSLVVDNELLLLDEPTSNLDIHSKKEIKNIISKVEKGFILIEHQFQEWLDLVERILVIGKDGNLAIDSKRDGFLQERENELIELGLVPSKEREDNLNLEEDNPLREENEKLLEVRKLNFKYSEKEILKDINFDLYKGEIMALLGKNGAGKTTLSKIIGGMESNYEGETLFKKRETKDIPVKELYKELAYVFQNPEYQFIKNSVKEELKLFKKIHGEGTDIKEILKKYNLEEVRNENPFILSGGQKRRLSVAVMLSKKHKLLILDEPTFGLDHLNTKNLMEQLTKLAQKGMGIIIITHNLDLVERYTTKTMVLRKGRVEFNNSTENFFKERGIGFLKEGGEIDV